MCAQETSPSGSPRRPWRLLVWSLLALAILVDVGVRLRLLDLPLERDEGEYAYAGQLLLEGIPPYQLAYNMKLPGTYLAYATIMAVFGQTPAGIHQGLLVVHLATLGVLFLIARKLLDFEGAAIATAAWALMTCSPSCLGLAAHATHFIMLPALLGILVLFRAEKTGRLAECLAGGCLFGIAFLMKQPGMFFGFFGGLYLIGAGFAGKIGWRRMLAQAGCYSLGCLLPFLVVCLWLKLAGVFPQFWFWTITYAREYATSMPISEGVEYARVGFAMNFTAAPLLWIMAGLGLVCLCLRRIDRRTRIFLGGLSGLLLSGALPGALFPPALLHCPDARRGAAHWPGGFLERTVARAKDRGAVAALRPLSGRHCGVRAMPA